MGNQVDMLLSTEVCTHSIQGLGLDKVLLGQTHGAHLHTTMHRSGADVGSQVDLHTHTDACTYFSQGVVSDEW